MAKWIIETVQTVLGKQFIIYIGEIESPYYKGSKGAREIAYKKFRYILKDKPIIVVFKEW